MQAHWAQPRHAFPPCTSDPPPGGGQDPVPVPRIPCLPPACRSQPLGHITHSPFFLCSLAMRSSSWRGPSGRARRRNRRGWRGCGGRSRRTWNWPSRSARLTCLPPRRGPCAGGTGHGQVPERGQCRCLYIHTHTHRRHRTPRTGTRELVQGEQTGCKTWKGHISWGSPYGGLGHHFYRSVSPLCHPPWG